MCEYVVEHSMFTEQRPADMQFSLKALEGTRYPDAGKALTKLGALFKHDAGDWLKVGFTAWGSDPNAQNKFSEFKTAILECRVAEFDCIDAHNRTTRRRLEPLTLWFKQRAWYVSGYDLNRRDGRTFRLSRIRGVEVLWERFQRDRARPAPPAPKEYAYLPVQACGLLFDQRALYRLYDDFDDGMFQKTGDGRYLVKAHFALDEWLYGYILGFGPSVMVVFPENLRFEIAKRAREIADLYQNT